MNKLKYIVGDFVRCIGNFQNLNKNVIKAEVIKVIEHEGIEKYWLKIIEDNRPEKVGNTYGPIGKRYIIGVNDQDIFSNIPIEDPNIIIAFDGSKQDKRHCYQISYKWYLKSECLIFNNEAYHKDDKRLCIDFITGKTILIKTSLRYINTIESDNKITYKYTISRIENSKSGPLVINFYGDQLYIESYDRAIELGFKEDLYSDNLYFDLKQSQFNKHNTKRAAHFNNQVLNTRKKNKLFKLTDAGKKKESEYNYLMGVDSNNFMITEGKQYTFGVEIETSSGHLPVWKVLQEDLNLASVHDGSILNENNGGGAEYVTGVLKGSHGFFQLNKICSVLSKRCTVNQSCGIHVHIGGFENNREFSLFSYLLGHRIQDDLFSILPNNRNYNEYCKRIDMRSFNIDKLLPHNLFNCNKEKYKSKISKAYIEMYKYLALGQGIDKKHNKKFPHPRGRYAGGREISPRYLWLNMIPCNFSRGEGSSYTIEFRNHSGTLNYTKIMNWILICMAFVHFVENYKREILQGYYLDSNGVDKILSLEYIIEKAYPKNKEKLLKYINERRTKFSDEAKAGTTTEYKAEENITDSKNNIKELICA